MYELSTPDLASAIHLCAQAPFMGIILGEHRWGASSDPELLAPSLEEAYDFKSQTHHKTVLIFPIQIQYYKIFSVSILCYLLRNLLLSFYPRDNQFIIYVTLFLLKKKNIAFPPYLLESL